MRTQDEWTGDWLAKKIAEDDDVESVEVISSNIIKIKRKALPTITVAALSEKTVTDDLVKESVGDEDEIAFVVNISKDSYFTGEALRYARAAGFGIGGYADLLRALSLPDPATYLPRTIEFIERGLEQHDKIKSFDREADLCYLIHRIEGRSSVRCVFLHEYELTAEHVRQARQRYGPFKIVVITDPNGSATTAAMEVAGELGAEVLTWGQFYGAMNKR